MQEMEGFEVFDHHMRHWAKEDSPIITLYQRGELALNQTAYEMLGCPSKVNLLFNRAERLIGIRPACDPTAKENRHLLCYCSRCLLPGIRY